MSFSALHATVPKAGCLSYHTLSSYDTNACAGHCNRNPRCGGFNVYIERDSVKVSSQSCPAPESVASYQCLLWDHDFSAKKAVSDGANAEGGESVVVGSNGYSKI